MGGGGSKTVEVVRYVEVPAPAPVVKKGPTVAEKLLKAFETVTVDWKMVDVGTNALKRAKATSFEYSLANDRFKGVKKEDLTTFGEAVCEKLHLTDDEKLKKQKAAVVSTFKLVAFAEEADGKVEELALTLDEFRSLYGFIFAAQNDEGKVDVAYTFYQLEFKLKEVVDGFTPDEMMAIKMHYSKNEALLTLKQENVIKEINYKNKP